MLLESHSWFRDQGLCLDNNDIKNEMKSVIRVKFDFEVELEG